MTPEPKRVPWKKTVSTDRLPPHSAEAEQGVLGCCLLEPGSCIQEARERIKSTEVFYDLRHQVIYRTLCALQARGEAVDVITLKQELSARKQLEDAGGIAYISALPDAVPSAANLPSYLDIVVEKYKLRKILNTCADITLRVYENDGPIEDLEYSVKSDLFHVLDNDRSEFPKFENAATVVERNTPEPVRLVEGLLHAGSKLCIGGGSKSYKSWALMDLALCVSLGLPWLELGSHASPVLYINFELPEWSFESRLRKLAAHKLVKLNPDTFSIWNLRGSDCAFTRLLPELEHRMAKVQTPPSLIVFDPVYKMYGANSDENSVNDTRLILGAVGRLCEQFGSAVAWAHHYSKGNQASKASIDRISGSGAWARDPDALLMFTAHAEPGAFTVEPTLRNMPPLPPFAVRWTHPVFKRDSELNPDDLKLAKPSQAPKRKAKTSNDLLAVMPLTGQIVKEKLVEMKPEGMSKEAAWESIKILISEGRLIEHRTKRSRGRDAITISRPVSLDVDDAVFEEGK